jgi:hypothetical protein
MESGRDPQAEKISVPSAMTWAAPANDGFVSLTAVGVIIGGLLLLDIDEANRVVC